MKKQDELRAQLARMKAEAEEKLKAGALEDAKAKVAEMDGIREQITLLDKLDADFADAVNTGMSGAKEAEKKPDAVARFADAARHGFKAATNLNETTGANGGYTVPEDIETQIRELRESADSLDRLVTVEQVTTLSGARTYKTRAQQTGMTKVAEGAALAAADGPSFTRVEYTVEKYGDLFYATNELLEDTDANIVGALIRWISGASRVGRNNLILSTINTALSAATELSDADGIKKAMNVTLDRPSGPTSGLSPIRTGSSTWTPSRFGRPLPADADGAGPDPEAALWARGDRPLERDARIHHFRQRRDEKDDLPLLHRGLQPDHPVRPEGADGRLLQRCGVGLGKTT